MSFDLTKLVESSTAAFAGAFFAFIFIKVSETLTKISKRKYDSYNALVKVDIMTNDLIDDLSASIYEMEQMIQHFESAKKKGRDVFSSNNPRSLTLEKSVLLDLRNIDFINDLFSFFRKVEKHNNDIKTITELHNSLKDARLEGRIDSENYMENMERFIENLKSFKNYSDDLQETTINISAICRVLMDSETTFRIKLQNKLLTKKYGKNFNSQKDKHKEILRKEIADPK